MMQTFDRPAGRIRAVYGKTKGLVARRKALAAMATQNEISSSESSDSESNDDDNDDDYDDEKENQIPFHSQATPTKNKSVSTSPCKPSSSTICISDSEEDEIILPSRRRINRPAAKIQAYEDEELDHLSHLIDSSLNITKKPVDKKVNIKTDRAALQSQHALLLSLCGQSRPEDFSTFLSRLEDEGKCRRWQKIGEASYSEVYGLVLSSSVIKVIPLLDPKQQQKSKEPLPEQSLISDVHREVEVTRALSKVADGFVKMHSAQVVQGRYPSRLLNARTARPNKEDETNLSPQLLPSTQSYAALELCNGGEDLESIEDLTWKQAASIFCQIVEALALAEEAHQFEHRDLHWGNVVIAPVEADETATFASKGNEVEHLKKPSLSGVKATIIDYTLSRATIGQTLIAYSFEDESLFEGQGDMQFDIYRQMRKETKGDWSGFYPHTNILWLNYLASKLIDEKNIPNPKRRSQLGHRASEELECRNFIMEAKQLLTSKRFESSSEFYKSLTNISIQ